MGTFPRWTLAFVAMAVAVIAAVGVWSYRSQEAQARESVESTLLSVAKMKARDITLWRSERLGDAFDLTQNSFLVGALLRWQAAPEASSRDELLAYFQSTRNHHGYAGYMVVDPQGKALLLENGHTEIASPEERAAIDAAVRTREPVLSDLFRSSDAHKLVCLSVVTPVFPAEHALQPAPACLIILRIDAAEYLYPLIQTWPTPSQSAETTLVRREGDSVLFLSDLRRYPDAALGLRIPLSLTNEPSVMAVLGKTGFVQGEDFSGEGVFSAIEPIPGTNWFLTTKMDRSEALTEWRPRSLSILVLFAALVCAVIAAGVLLHVRTTAVAAHDRSQAKKAMSLERERSAHIYQELAAIVDSAEDAIISENLNGIITSWNPGAQRMFGYSAEEMIGKSVMLLISQEKREEELRVLERIRTSRLVSHLETTRVRKDGGQIDVSIMVSPILNENGEVEGASKILRDIGDRMRAEAEIRQLNASLEQRVTERTAELTAANEELDSFAYAVSHDLRAPLRAMSGFSQALVEDFSTALPDDANVYLEQITLASQHMSRLIDGLLTLSRSTRGTLRRDAIDVSAMCERVRGELELTAPDRPVTWEIESGLTARGDPRMVEVLIHNLLENAWKYTTGTKAPRIRFFSTTEGGATCFNVADNGAGFDMDHVGILFKPFQRLHRQEEFPGIGIGLATVQRIVHRHGGQIRATAALKLGATFTFSLYPAATAEKEGI